MVSILFVNKQNTIIDSQIGMIILNGLILLKSSNSQTNKRGQNTKIFAIVL